ncbi:MAG: phosphopantetheine-binding protein [Sutterellaceae bacterium]|nr:phosphopantetheine-binding protein [Sutterellaceae bacterium]MDD7442685.1 phosphopantetheine-binding protein [Sutterellaceae bacterium]MDY2867640.1 phosphopantetheine-binding protein [Mesosutterella sp.]
METLEQQLKELIIDSLELEDMAPGDIPDDAPLFSSDGVGLDSIDALELGMAIKKKFGVTLNGENEKMRSHFRSVATLAAYIRAQKGETD